MASTSATEPGVAVPKVKAPKLPSGVSAKRMFALALPEWRRIALGTLFLIVGSGASLVYPQAVKYVLDEALAERSQALVDRAAVVMVGIFLVQGLAIALRFVLFTVAGERIVADLREKLYRAIVRQEIAFFDQRRTGELMNRLSSDTTILQNTVSVNISMVLRNIATGLGGVVMLFYTSAPLAGLILLVVPPVSLGAVFYGRRLRRLARDVQDTLAKAAEVAEESLGGIRTVRSFTAEDQETARYESAIEESFRLARRRAVLSGTFIGIVSIAGFAAGVLVLWYGGSLVVDGDMSVGELTSFLIYSVIVATALGAVSNLWVDFMKASGAAERVFELLDRAPAMNAGVGLQPDSLEGALRLEGVSFRYPSRPDVTVLDDVTVELSPGQVVALVGPSGSGKSTIASLVGRLYDPTSGTLWLDDHPLSELDPEWLRQRVGVVSQEPILFSTTVRENIRYGRPDASDEEVQAAAKAANAHDFISLFPAGYETEVGERGVQLSGGQKQRVAIARAVLKDPRILILDEATSALDAESEHLVKEALDNLMVGRTTLIIAHRLSTVADADQVVVLSNGTIAQQGTHEALLDQGGLYKQLVERQFVSH